MKYLTKKLLACLLVCAMLVPMGVVSSFGMEADAAVTANWKTMAAKYSKGTWKIIAPKTNDYKIVTDGFTFDRSDMGGIKATVPDYNTFKGTYAVSAVSSKAATPIDGLSVVISADKFDSMLDKVPAGNIIGILWTEAEINEIAAFNETSKSYDKGVYSAVSAYSTGLRSLIPTVEGATERTPAFDSKATPNGQALYISVACEYQRPDAAPIASTVEITYYDGYYINGDGNPGYRWQFRARNNKNTGNSDSTRLSQNWEQVDLSDGLAVSVRADNEHGFIVTVNGYDYYRGEDVCYFPDAKPDWYGYYINDLNDDRIEEMDDVYINTMTYEKKDIDLSRLATAGEGYLTIGTVSNNDQYLEGHGSDYTVEYINGVPAADWKGEELSADHVCDMVYLGTKPATCVRAGGDTSMCKVCGKYNVENIIPATGHTKGELTCLEDPKCDNYGTMAAFCTVCQCMVEGYGIPKPPHTFTAEWTGEFTCETGGTRTNTCDECGQTITETLEPGHVYEWVVTTEPTCAVEGVETQICGVCGAVGETRAVPASGDAHVGGVWTPVVNDGAWDGTEQSSCTICGATTERKVNVYDYIKHFEDIKQNQWYEDEVAYCVQLGYVSGMSETRFAPNASLTRAQFLTLLAKVDGVDLIKYHTTDSGFKDVKQSHWFNEVVCWAVEKGYTSGVSATNFGPNNNITREQLARFFYVYTEKKGGDVDGRADISAFEDASKVSSWATENVQWAVETGLISGTSATKLSPKGTATRAQAARMIMIYTQLDLCRHEWSEWEVVTEGNISYEMRICVKCKLEEHRDIFRPYIYHTVTFVLPLRDYEQGARIDGSDEISVSYEVREGQSFTDAIGNFLTVDHPHALFTGWMLEEYGFLVTEAEWDSFIYVLNGDYTFYASFEGGISDAFSLIFDEDGDITTNEDRVYIVHSINNGDKYSELMDELPLLQKEGYIHKGWYNKEYKIAVSFNSFNEKVFNIEDSSSDPIAPLNDITPYLFHGTIILLTPIWDVDNEKEYTLTFINNEVEGFEPIVYNVAAGDSFLSIFAGDFPDPGEYSIDDTMFVGWNIEDLNFTLTENDMWYEGYLALTGNWVFTALYVEI